MVLSLRKGTSVEFHSQSIFVYYFQTKLFLFSTNCYYKINWNKTKYKELIEKGETEWKRKKNEYQNRFHLF